MKKFFCLILTLVLILCAVPVYADDLYDLNAGSALLIDMTTGKTLYEKNSDAKQMPGSMAKMLTAYLGIKNLNMGDYITVDEELIDGLGVSSLGLLPGEVMGIGVMISAMVLTDDDAAAYVIADAVSGDVSKFVELMNETAAEIGCTDTHFTNPAGSDDPDQYTSCEDLAKIAAYCMQDEVFARVAAKTEMYLDPTNLSPEKHISNINLLLWGEGDDYLVYVDDELRYCKYDGCLGIQAGYTDGSGACLVSAVKQGDTTLLAVVLNDGPGERYADTIKLFDYGFANYQTVKLDGVELGTTEITVKKGSVTSVSVKADIPQYLTVSAGADAGDFKTILTIDDYIEAPAEAGTKVGSLQLLSDVELIAEYDVVTSEDISEGDFFSRIGLSGINLKNIFKKIDFSHISFEKFSFKNVDFGKFNFKEIGLKEILLLALAVVLAIILFIILIVLIDKRRTAVQKARRARKRAEIEARDKAFLESLRNSKSEE